jgi:hypothetical protein
MINCKKCGRKYQSSSGDIEGICDVCKLNFGNQQGLSAGNAGYASEAVPACGNCVLMPFCGIYKKWKEDEAEYFEKDIEDFYCKHFTASKPEA